MRFWLPVGILLVVLAPSGVGGVDVQLTTQDIQRATELARWPHTDAERAQFHKRYTVVVNGPVVEYFAVESIEVTTPFRRMELIAEDHARINDLFARGGVRDAEEALRPWRNQLSIVVRLRFELTKLIPGIPDADVTLEGPRVVSPITISPSGIYTGNRDHTFLVGALLNAVFDVGDVDQAKEPVVVWWKGKEIARAAVDFAAIE